MCAGVRDWRKLPERMMQVIPERLTLETGTRQRPGFLRGWRGVAVQGAVSPEPCAKQPAVCDDQCSASLLLLIPPRAGGDAPHTTQKRPPISRRELLDCRG